MTARLLVAVLLALVAAWTSPPPAAACSCAESTDAGYAERADVIFTGTVADDQQGEPRTLTFSVERVYQGQATATQVVSTAGSTASCGLSIDESGSYLVYAQQEQTGLVASLCGGTRPGAAPASLGPGQPPQPDPTRPDPGRRTGFWVPLVGLILAATAAAVVGLALLNRRPT